MRGVDKMGLVRTILRAMAKGLIHLSCIFMKLYGKTIGKDTVIYRIEETENGFNVDYKWVSEEEWR